LLLCCTGNRRQVTVLDLKKWLSALSSPAEAVFESGRNRAGMAFGSSNATKKSIDRAFPILPIFCLILFECQIMCTPGTPGTLQ
jgi:hypothetical protein